MAYQRATPSTGFARAQHGLQFLLQFLFIELRDNNGRCPHEHPRALRTTRRLALRVGPCEPRPRLRTIPSGRCGSSFRFRRAAAKMWWALIATNLGERLGQAGGGDNRGGAAGIGPPHTKAVAKSPADGTRLGSISMAARVNPWLYKLSYDTDQGFPPVGLLAKGANRAGGIVAPVKCVPVTEWWRSPKQKPGDLQLRTAGRRLQHARRRTVQLMAGVDICRRQRRRTGDVAIVGGHTKVMFSSM